MIFVGGVFWPHQVEYLRSHYVWTEVHKESMPKLT